MSFAGDVWLKLAAIDVSKHVKTKTVKYKNGGVSKLSYLSWAWAWGIVMTIYPESTYEFEDVRYFNDGTAEVWCTVVISNDENCFSRKMWLPVMSGFTNASVVNPTSRDINDTRMRCLTKCLAMFGLGHYIYAGEDIPSDEVTNESVKIEYKHLVSDIKNALGNEYWEDAKSLLKDIPIKHKLAIWEMFSSDEKSKIKNLDKLIANRVNDKKDIKLDAEDASVNQISDQVQNETDFVNKLIR